MPNSPLPATDPSVAGATHAVRVSDAPLSGQAESRRCCSTALSSPPASPPDGGGLSHGCAQRRVRHPLLNEAGVAVPHPRAPLGRYRGHQQHHAGRRTQRRTQPRNGEDTRQRRNVIDGDGDYHASVAVLYHVAGCREMSATTEGTPAAIASSRALDSFLPRDGSTKRPLRRDRVARRRVAWRSSP